MVFAVVFHQDGMDRIQAHDPAVVQGYILQEAFNKADMGLLLLQSVDFLFCYELDREVFLAKVKELGDGEAVIQWLGRNWESRPGDVFEDGTIHKYSDVEVES